MISNEYEALTPEAQDFEKEIETALRPIFLEHFGDQAFTFREMGYLASESVTLLTAELIVRNAAMKWKHRQ
jgi:hypothetical protein